MTAALLETMRLLGRELHARHSNDLTVLCRFARYAPITGHPITGFARA